MTTQAAAHTMKAPEPITRFSELGTAPEKIKWWAPFGFVLVVIFTLLILIPLIILSPLIIIEIIGHRMYVKRYKYHREPKDLKVAIVGGGWGGLQCLERFKQLGVDNVDVFERYDDIGGTWHKNLRYNGLQIHGSMIVTSFDEFPFSEDKDVMGGKVLAEEVEKYIHRYVEANKLKPHVHLNSNIDEVHYDSNSKKATVSITDTATGAKRESGPYDMVIWASTAAFGNIPHIKGAENFKGKQMHTTLFRADEFDEIVKNNKKVIVVGGGKAAVDMVLSFRRSGHQNVTWMMRKPYLFYKYEVLLHNGSLLNKIRGVSYLCTMLWTGVSTRLSAFLHWSSGYLYTFGKPHTDFTHFHGGILCPTQRRDIEGTPYMIGEPVSFTETGIVMKDGSEMECDALIWATGNKTGIDTLKLVKDGQPYSLDPKAKLYNHFIVPDFPALASSTALFTTFGPLRGTNSAELTVFHHCIRRPRTEAEMQRAANRQMSKNSILYSFLWTKKANWIQQWVYFHIDLMLAGITSVEDFLKHALQVFAFSKDTRLRFNILPKGVK